MVDETDITVETKFTVHIERNICLPLKNVWKAISDENEISDWMEYPAKLDLKLGGRVFIDFSDGDPVKGVVCDIMPFKVISYTWGKSVIYWELIEEDNNTKLKFAHYGIERKFLVGICAGWQCFIDNLIAHLNGNTFSDRYDVLVKQYEQELHGIFDKDNFLINIS